MDIILIRHGKSQGNKDLEYAKDDSPLIEEGIEDLLKTKERLKDFKYDKVYSSPLKRALQTCEVLGIEDYNIDDRLKEMDFGIFKGMKLSEVRENHFEELDKWRKNIPSYIIPGGENRTLLYDRVVSFLEEKKSKDEDILLITHEGVIRLAFCWALDNEDLYYRFSFENGAINLIRIVSKDFKVIKKANLI